MALWNIGKANAEIQKLTAENAALKENLTKAESAISENESEAIKAAERLEADLSTAKQTISTLTKERDAAFAVSLADTKQISDLKAQLDAKESSVAIKVSQQVQATQAALGQPPVPAIPSDATTTAGGAPKAKPLFGLERFIAAEKAEAALKTK